MDIYIKSFDKYNESKEEKTYRFFIKNKKYYKINSDDKEPIAITENEFHKNSITKAKERARKKN